MLLSKHLISIFIGKETGILKLLNHLLSIFIGWGNDILELLNHLVSIFIVRQNHILLKLVAEFLNTKLVNKTEFGFQTFIQKCEVTLVFVYCWYLLVFHY